MNIESDNGKVAKENRRNNLESEKNREFSHPFKLQAHLPTKKQRERRQHTIERRALKRRK